MKHLFCEIKEQASPYNLGMAFLGSLIVLPILIAFFSTFEFLYYKATPAKWNVEYHGVIPQKSVFHKDELPSFLSDRTIKHTTSLSYNDTLFCDVYENKKFGVVGSIFFSENRLVEKHERDQYPWTMTVDIPEKAENCYLRSQITDNRPYGITKTQEVVGRTFRVNGSE